jgi:hypothetical protein
VKPASIVRVHLGPETATTSGTDTAVRTMVITGLAVAAFLLLLAAAVPATAARFTAPGRAVMAHQMDLALAGVGTLLLTVMLLLITGSGV